MKQTGKRVYNNDFFMFGGGVPFSSDLTFYSKERIDEFVKNKLDATADSDGKLVGRKYGKFDGITNDASITEITIPDNYLKIKFKAITTESLINDNGTLTFLMDGDTYYSQLFRFRVGFGLGCFWVGNTSGLSGWYPCTIPTDTNPHNYELIINNGIATIKCDETTHVFDGTAPDITGLFINTLFRGVSIDRRMTAGMYDLEIETSNGVMLKSDYSSGRTDGFYDIINSNFITVSGNPLEIKYDLTEIPYNAVNGFSIISGVDGEVPAVLGTQFDALNGDPLTNPATSKIVSNVDGYIIMPDDIKITVDIEGTPTKVGIFDRSNPYLYTNDARNVLDYLGYDYRFYWGLDKLSTANIISWLQPNYKFSWFVKNTFTEGTFDPITIKEIMAYKAPITGADNLSKMMKYLGLNIWFDSQTWDDDEIWID